MRHRLTALLVSVLLALPCPAGAQEAAPSDQLATVVENATQGAPFGGALWGVQVVNLRTGATLHSRRADALFVPASNVKLLTAAAALEQLGPSYRYRTRLYADGPVVDGTLQGNLLIRGAGDPSFGSEHHADDVTQVFRAWADSLKAAGIRHVAGDIVGDDNIFSDTPLGHGWSWDDVPYAYSAEIGGLVYNENKIDLRLRGQTPGAPGAVEWSPLNTSYVTIVNQSRTVAGLRDGDEAYERTPGTNTIRVATRLPPGGVEEEALTITNPTLYAAHVFREVLLREGISVGGAPVDLDAVPFEPGYARASVRSVAHTLSPPLREIVGVLNRESANLYAEQLLRTLSVETPPDSTDPRALDRGTSALGARRVGATLARAGVDTSAVQVVDGSGLSRQNLVSPSMLVRLLVYMRAHPGRDVREAFIGSLPVGGRDGTLEYRFRGSAPAEGRVRAKTGTLSNVSALSGYVSAADGTPLAFSIVCNHHVAESSAVRAAQDAIVNALARLEL